MIKRNPAAVQAVAQLHAGTRRYRNSLAALLPHEEAGPITFRDFRQIVRRHKPSELLPVLALMACDSFSAEGTTHPWVVALAARESLLWGNEHRDDPVDVEALRVLVNAANNIGTPDLLIAKRTGPGPTLVRDLMTRLAYEQVPYQEPVFMEVARSQALLVEGLAHVDNVTFTAGTAERLLGAPLGPMVGVTFALQVVALTHGGWIDRAWLATEIFAPLYAYWPRELFELRLDQLSATPQEFKDAYASGPKVPLDYERYAPNPLQATPLIVMPDGRLLAPQPLLISMTLGFEQLRVVGAREFSAQAFGNDLGRLAENYVGRQLASVVDPGVELHPEVVYREPPKRERKSIDWFWVFDSMVVMFEVKNTRYWPDAKAALAGSAAQIDTVLDKAVEQIDNTTSRLDAEDPAFSHIPKDRPRLGVVVTTEPFHLANDQTLRTEISDRPENACPVLVASLRDVESLVLLPPAEIERQLMKVASKETATWNLQSSLDFSTAIADKNPILAQAWDAFPMPATMKSYAPDEDT